MLRHRLAQGMLLCLLTASAAFAQADDDLLAPLAPVQKPKKKPKAKPRVKPRGTAPVGDDLLAPLAPPSGTADLLVKVLPPVKGARLFIDDRELGLVGTAPFSVPVGERLVVVRRPGFADFSRRVQVSPGKVTEVAASLEAVQGIVVVSSDVVGAQVLVDGQHQGTTPLPELLLQPGQHEIVVRKEGVGQEAQRLLVRAGREHAVSVRIAGQAPAFASSDRPERGADLTPPSAEPSNEVVATVAAGPGDSQPLYKRWYVWAGAAAVVVAAVASGVAVANSKPSGDPACTNLPKPTDACDGQPCDWVMNYPTQCPQ